jgi:hypothetical protein
MVISLGLKRTVLWDQIEYSGSPEDFVWLLPVPSAEATVEVADGAFFDVIEGYTKPVVLPATAGCAASSGGCGGSGFAGGGLVGNPNDVTIYSQQTVGPYDVVTIGSEDPTALYAWLGVNNYRVAPDVVPIFDDYIEGGSVFVILRLAPGEGVQAMQPVRVSYPGTITSFPLKMTVVGARGELSLSLWVIAEQRYQALNYETILADESDLVWDWATETSNYDEAFAAWIDRAGGRAWVVEYAAPLEANELTAELAIEAPDDLAVVERDNPFPYITRLRSKMLIDHLDQDMRLAQAEDASNVSRTLYATTEINPQCEQAQSGSGAIRKHDRSRWLALMLLVALATWLGFRRSSLSRE